MNSHLPLFAMILLSIVVMPTAHANTEADQIELHKDSKFALGVGVAVVRFDTGLKFTDKTKSRFGKIFIDPESELDLPKFSTVTALYGAWNINPKHNIGFSYFHINRESSLYINDTFEDVKIVGNAKITDSTSFYELTYGYALFTDERSKIRFHAGIYGLDLKYVFEAEGEITEGGSTRTGSISDEAKVFAPLPLIGVDLWYSFTPEWGVNTRIAFVGGSYEDVSAFVLQSRIAAQYIITEHVGILFGLTYFDAEVTIEDEVDKTEVDYGYDGAYIGAHFIF